jgi:hypothetical protein
MHSAAHCGGPLVRFFNKICFYYADNVDMEKRYTDLKNHDLLEKLIELASQLCTGRKTDPNAKNVRNQLEAIQIEIESRQKFPGDMRMDMVKD